MADTGGGGDIVTLLFTDLVGSTELLQNLGDDSAEAVRRSHFRLLRDVVAAHGGHEVKNLGDGLMVVFGSALDALRSAVTIQRAVSRHNRTGQGHPFAIRVGLHAGEPVREEDDFFGTPVVVARRLCDAAGGGQILASQLLVGLVGSRGAFAFRSVGPLALKGLADPVATVEVSWEPEGEPGLSATDGRGGAGSCVGLRLLGPLEVVAGTAGAAGSPGQVVDIGSAKQRAVLAVLGLHLNEVVSRAQLVDRLWGDRPPASATVTLRSLVSRLRKALDGLAVGFEIVTREPGWTLRGEPGVVDAAEFRALTAEARLLLAAGDPPAAAVTWRKALGLWRGAALVDVVDAGYLTAEATHLDEARLDATEDLIDAELASGWPSEALGHLEGHVAAHPLRERAWGQLMVALYHLGRQAEALRAYQRLRAVLREELGLDPTPDLADLEARILRHDASLAPPQATAASEQAVPTRAAPAAGRIAATVAAPLPFASGSPERTPFVGRVAELATLSTALERARAGSGGMMLVGGEPGIGKTRLAEEAAREAAAAGMQVFVGHSYEISGAAPYVAVVEILEAALAAAPSVEAFVADVLGDAAPEAARLLPQLRRRFPDLPPPLELPPAQERLYLFRCLSDILARLAQTRPTLVLLDDLQWADDATLLFVEHLAPQLAGLPLLVVATYRDTDVGRPLARTFGDLHRRRLAGRISLGALTPLEAGELVAGLAGQDAPAELVDALHATTDGNVFFLEEIVRDLAESGRAFDDAGRFRAGVAVDDLGLPEGVRLVIERRLDRLSEAARSALSAGAVSGRVFSVPLLQALGDLDGEAVLDIVDEAEQAVLIAPSGNADEFLFAHELIRQTLVAGLSGTRRRRLHARAAEALERIHAQDVRAAAATIAHHLLEAGPAADPKRTFHYLKTAAESAMETSAFEEAVRHFESALLLSDAATARELADLRSGLGRAQRSLWQLDQAAETWKDAVDAYETLGDFEAAGRICADAAYSLAIAARFEEASAILERGIGLLGDRVSATRAGLLAHQGFLTAYVGVPFEVGDALIAQALAIADELGQPALRGWCLLSKTLHRLAWMHCQEVAEAGLEAAELLKAAGSSWEEAWVLGWAGYGLVGAGRFDEARNVTADLELLAERLGDGFALMQCRRVEHGMVGYTETGDLDALEAFAWRDLKLAMDSGMPWVSNSHGWLGLAFFFKGDWDQARKHLETAADMEPPSSFQGWDRSLLFEFRAYAGQRKLALAMLDADDAPLPVPGQPNGWGRWAMLLAAVEGLYVLGERARAASYYDLVVECIERTRVICAGFQDSRLPHRTAGIAAMAGRSWDHAEVHFRTALRQAEALPHLPEQAHARRFFASMLLERDGPGDRAEATQMAAEAADLYRRMGMPRHIAMVEALLA